MSDSTHTIEIEPTETTDYVNVGDHADPIPLIGYPPKKQPRAVRRLHKQPGSETYVEIKVQDIVDPPRGADKPHLERGQIAIWVQCLAYVQLVEVDVNAIASRKWPRS